MVKTTNKKQAIKPGYEAFILSETVIEQDPSGMGFSESRSIGLFPNQKEAEKAAVDHLQGTPSAVGYFMRKARKQ